MGGGIPTAKAEELFDAVLLLLGESLLPVANAVASLAQRSTITDPNVQQMFMRPVPVTTRQGRRTQSLGSSELKRSLIT